MDVIQYKLDNGTQVILHSHASAPVVSCSVWVGVGSADETASEAGLAHVHEHMLFKGTEHRGVGQVAREVEASGGHINAFTSFDQTCYYVVMSSKFFDKGLDILSDVIQRSSFDAEELGRELQVIQEEIKQCDDNPSRVAISRLFETAYEDHPYRLPIIGTKESVDSFTRDDVVRFYKKHYVPSNMTVVLVGDFEEADAREKVEAYFGKTHGEPYSSVERPDEQPQRDVRVAVLDEAAQDTHLRIGFHIPNATHEDVPALELLGVILGAGESSRLHYFVQREQQLVNGIGAGASTLRDSGLFSVAADYQLKAKDEEGPGPVSHEEVLEAVFAQVVDSMDADFEPAEIFRARTLIESQAIYSKQTIEGLGRKYGHYHMTTGDVFFEDLYYERLAKVTIHDLQRVARTYLKAANCTVIISHPKESLTIAPDTVEAIVRNAFDARPDTEPSASNEIIEDPLEALNEPTSYPALDLDEDGFHVVDIEDGPLLIIQEDHAVEMFSVRALTYGGVRLERPEDNGINSLLTELLVRGTSSMNAVELAMTIESMASGINGISGRNTFGVALSGLSKYLDPCLDLMAECWFDATIPEDEVQREKSLLIQHIKSRKEQLGSANFSRFAQAFFGDHPYSRPVSGTLETVEALEAQTLRDYFATTIRGQRLVMVVAGDIQAGHVVSRIKALFANQPNKPLSLDLTPPKARDTKKLVLGDLDKNQAHVIVGFDAPVVGSDDRYALEVLHAILSGQGGRLFMELRDKQSLAYSVYANMLMGLETGTFMINIGTSPEKIEQAVKGIFEQVRILHEGTIESHEITEAKQYLIGNHDIGLQRASSRAMSVALDALYGQGFKRMYQYGDAIQSVTVEDIQGIIERYLVTDTAVVAITKPGEVDVPADLLD